MFLGHQHDVDPVPMTKQKTPITISAAGKMFCLVVMSIRARAKPM